MKNWNPEIESSIERIEKALRSFQSGVYSTEDLFLIFESDYHDLPQEMRAVYRDIFLDLDICAARGFEKRDKENVRRSVDEYLSKHDRSISR